MKPHYFLLDVEINTSDYKKQNIGTKNIFKFLFRINPALLVLMIWLAMGVLLCLCCNFARPIFRLPSATLSSPNSRWMFVRSCSVYILSMETCKAVLLSKDPRNGRYIIPVEIHKQNTW